MATGSVRLLLLLMMMMMIASAASAAANPALSNSSNSSNSSYSSKNNNSSSSSSCNSSITVGNSNSIQFHFLSGQRAFSPARVRSSSSDSNERTVVCSYSSGSSGSSSSSSSSITYRLRALGAELQPPGRVLEIPVEAFGVWCHVTVASADGCVQQQHWAVLLLVPDGASAGGNFQSLWGSKKSWIADSKLSLKSALAEAKKGSANTILCSVVIDPSRMQNAHLQLKVNAIAIEDLQPTFKRTASGVVHQLLMYNYTASNARDIFTCSAFDPLRQVRSVAKITVTYAAGVTAVRILDPQGKEATEESELSSSDSLLCVPDVSKPEVNFQWRVMKQNSMQTVAGAKLKLNSVNLFYPICCTAGNYFDGRNHTATQCRSVRGDVIPGTQTLLDKPGRRHVNIACGVHSHMGLLQVRYSKLKCSEGNRSGEQCDTTSCASPTAMKEIWRSCQNSASDRCRFDATILMSEFMMSSLRLADSIDAKCFSWGEPGLIKIEIDYFCSKPKELIFRPSGSGRSGQVQRYRVPATGCYEIVAHGAAGGNHSTNYGPNGAGTWYGGRGATISGKFFLRRYQRLSVVVGQHGGNSSEMSSSRNGSIEDNAGTGGGGGSFVYIRRQLYLAAGGGGGASYGLNGTEGQSGPNGSGSNGSKRSQRGRGGVRGGPGYTNTARASYHGGAGAGWRGSAGARAGTEHGGPGGSWRQGWVGGEAGGMNPGAYGGFGGGGGGSEDNGASGGGGGYSGGGAGSHDKQGGGGGGSYCNRQLANHCSVGVSAGNQLPDGSVSFFMLGPKCDRVGQ